MNQGTMHPHKVIKDSVKVHSQGMIHFETKKKAAAHIMKNHHGKGKK